MKKELELLSNELRKRTASLVRTHFTFLVVKSKTSLVST